jgi:signal transduction histidine kinase
MSISILCETIVEHAPLGILAFKAEGPCIFANRMAENIFGVSSRQFKRHNFRNSITWKRSGNIPLALEVLKSGGKHKFTATVGKRKMHIVGTLSSFDFFQAPHLLAIFSDMSDKIETERALLVAREVSVENLKRALLAEKKIADVGEDTRRQIGQELHDDLGQHLTGLAFIVENLSHNLHLKQLPESREAARITVLINEAIEKTRLLARQLYPLLSAEENLETRLAILLQHIESTFGISCRLDCTPGLIHDPEVAANLYRIVQESVHNAVKHSGGNKISVRLYAKPDAIIMEVADNGLGMGEKRLSSAYNGLGIQIMQSRAALLGATLAFHALPSGGVKLLVTLPSQNAVFINEPSESKSINC